MATVRNTVAEFTRSNDHAEFDGAEGTAAAGESTARGAPVRNTEIGPTLHHGNVA